MIEDFAQHKKFRYRIADSNLALSIYRIKDSTRAEGFMMVREEFPLNRKDICAAIIEWESNAVVQIGEDVMLYWITEKPVIHKEAKRKDLNTYEISVAHRDSKGYNDTYRSSQNYRLFLEDIIEYPDMFEVRMTENRYGQKPAHSKFYPKKELGLD
jgi:hypothetical protein